VTGFRCNGSHQTFSGELDADRISKLDVLRLLLRASGQKKKKRDFRYEAHGVRTHKRKRAKAWEYQP
jgi:hypothetical protein